MLQLIKDLRIGLSVVAFLFASATHADAETQIADQQAALQACVDQEKADTCSFTNSSGESASGVCGNNAAGKLTCLTYQVD